MEAASLEGTLDPHSTPQLPPGTRGPQASPDQHVFPDHHPHSYRVQHSLLSVDPSRPYAGPLGREEGPLVPVSGTGWGGGVTDRESGNSLSTRPSPCRSQGLIPHDLPDTYAGHSAPLGAGSTQRPFPAASPWGPAGHPQRGQLRAPIVWNLPDQTCHLQGASLRTTGTWVDPHPQTPVKSSSTQTPHL